MDFFLCIAWPVVIPWYAWKTRGWSGWRLILLLFVLIQSAYVGVFVGSWFA